MRRAKTAAIMLTALLVLSCLAFWLTFIPIADPQPLPDHLIAVDTDRGRTLLHEADAIEDFEELSRSFEPLVLNNFCGVASSVAVLNGMGRNLTQTGLFNNEASSVRPIWRVAVQGMTLGALSGIVRSHGAKAQIHRADASSLDAFREAVVRNLSTDGDYLVVNYQREKLGQRAIAHISPLAAYNRKTDRALLMDTAAHKYPHTWVPLPALFAAMATTDPESLRSRGWLEISEAKHGAKGIIDRPLSNNVNFRYRPRHAWNPASQNRSQDLPGQELRLPDERL